MKLTPKQRKRLIEAMQADFNQHYIDSLTPDRGYGFPTDNVEKFLSRLRVKKGN